MHEMKAAELNTSDRRRFNAISATNTGRKCKSRKLIARSVAGQLID